MSDHGHGGGGGHGGGDHGHAKPKGGGGGGGGGGSVSLTFQNGLLLFFGLPLLVLGLAWAESNMGAVMLFIDGVISVIFLLVFLAYRLTWTFPLLEDKHRSRLWNRGANFILRTPAMAFASACLLWIFLRSSFGLWHPRPGPNGFDGTYGSHIPEALVITLVAWVLLNMASWAMEWLMYKLIGLHWPEPHAADH